MTSSTQNVHLDGHGGLDITASVTVPHGPPLAFTPTAAPSLRQSGGEMMVTPSILHPGPDNALGFWPALAALVPRHGLRRSTMVSLSFWTLRSTASIQKGNSAVLHPTARPRQVAL